MIGSWQDPDGKDASGNHATDEVIAFDSAQIEALTTYIQNGGNFALGFDPDCHYFNKSVSFEITTSPVPDAGGTALMLALSALGMAAMRRGTR